MVTVCKSCSLLKVECNTPYDFLEYVNVDDNWMEKTRDAQGNLQVRKDKFPHGMKYLADYAHSKGLKFGICQIYLWYSYFDRVMVTVCFLL